MRCPPLLAYALKVGAISRQRSNECLLLRLMKVRNRPIGVPHLIRHGRPLYPQSCHWPASARGDETSQQSAKFSADA